MTNSVKKEITRTSRHAGVIYLWVCLVVLMLTVMLTGCRSETETESPAPQMNTTVVQSHDATIAAVGDSLTAGFGLDEHQAYPAVLQEKLSRSGYAYNVVNAGISGETSSGTRSRIQWIISSLKPDIVILETGANDGLRGIDTGVTTRNIDEIVTTLKANGIIVILAGMKIPPNLGGIYTKAFENIFPEIAAKHDILLIPFFLEGVAGVNRLNLPDGIHPTARGYHTVVENVYPFVIKAIDMLNG